MIQPVFAALRRLKLAVVQLTVKAARRQKLLVRALFYDFAVAHDENQRCVADGRQTMCDHKAGASFHQGIKCLLYKNLRARINAGSGLIQD